MHQSVAACEEGRESDDAAHFLCSELEHDSVCTIAF